MHERAHGMERIDGRHWRRFAAENGFDPDVTVERIDNLASRVPKCLAQATETSEVQALRSELPTRLLEVVSARASRCQQALARR